MKQNKKMEKPTSVDEIVIGKEVFVPIPVSVSPEHHAAGIEIEPKKKYVPEPSTSPEDYAAGNATYSNK